MPATVEFDGMDTLVAVMHNVSPRVTQYLTGEMMNVSNDVFNESQFQCPVDTGALKGSGHVDEPDASPGNITINIGYGGPAAKYALFVHENLAMQHEPPTKAKFLEDPMNTALANLTSRLAGRMEAAIVGQYPTAPARAVSSAISSQTKSAYRNRSAKSITRRIARSRAMTSAEIESALHALSTGRSTGRFGFNTARSTKA